VQRTLRIVLGVLALGGATARADDGPAPGEADGVPAYETVVTGAAPDGDGTSIDTIDRADIEQAGARTAAEALETEASVHATTGSRGERIFRLRGFDERQTAVLLDGAPFGVPYDGQVDLEMIPSGLLDHATLVKGPGSVLFGPNGMGGAVNLVTRRPGTGPIADLGFEGGDLRALRLWGSASLRAGPAAWIVAAGRDTRDAWRLPAGFVPTSREDGGTRRNSDASSASVGASVRVDVAEDHAVTGTFTFVDADRGVPPSTVDRTPRYWRFSDWQAIGASIAHEGRWPASVDSDASAYLRRFENTLDSYDGADYASQSTARAFRTTYTDWIAGARARVRHRSAWTAWLETAERLWLGVQYERHGRSEAILATDPGKAFSRTVLTMAPEVEAFWPHGLSSIVSCQVDVELPGEVEGFVANPRVAAGPLLSLRYDPVDSLVLRVTGARRTRFPTLKERFSYALGFREPNPDLRPESAWHAGLDASWHPLRWLAIEAGFSDAEVSDLIEVRPLGNGRDQQQNVGSARLLAVEASVRLRPWAFLDGSVGWQWLHARRTDLDPPEDRLEYRPEHKVVASIAVRPLAWIELSSRATVVGPQDFPDPDTARPMRLGWYATLDARLDVRPAPFVTLWIRGTNLTDALYVTEYGYPRPGREILAGMRIAPM
jgi:iron complex outermembrane receptor protein